MKAAVGRCCGSRTHNSAPRLIASTIRKKATSGATPTIAAGAQNGAEMGAFAREMNPIKERGLLIKYQEFMPAGLVAVLVYVT